MKKGMKKELSAKEKEKIKKKIAEIPKENLRFSKNGRPYDKEKLKEKCENNRLYGKYYKELRECRKHINIENS